MAGSCVTPFPNCSRHMPIENDCPVDAIKNLVTKFHYLNYPVKMLTNPIKN